MRELHTCPSCRGPEATPVCEYNGLLFLDDERDGDLARYDYALCHACGTVYAARRPDGGEYGYLLSNFNENLGRADDYVASNPVANHLPLTESQREELRARFKHGWLVSEESPPPADEWLPQLLADRNNHMPHLDLLASSIDLRGKRVLEIRSKTGWLPQVLRDWFGCEVYALPAFEALQVLVRDFYDVRADALIDFDRFEIPYDGEFDLIAAKHMITHALHPAEFLATVRERLRPGGHAYFYTENDDSRMFDRGKNVFREMKPYHFQNMDIAAFGRTLRANGFEPLFIRHTERSAMAALARVDPAAKLDPMGAPERDARLAMYRTWRERSILELPRAAREPFREEVSSTRVLAHRARSFGERAGAGVRSLVGTR